MLEARLRFDLRIGRFVRRGSFGRVSTDDPSERLRQLAERRQRQKRANGEAERRLEDESAAFMVAFHDWQREIARRSLEEAARGFP